MWPHSLTGNYLTSVTDRRLWLGQFRQPGREHWVQTVSIFLAGGGMPMGQVIGSTSLKGDEPASRALKVAVPTLRPKRVRL